MNKGKTLLITSLLFASCASLSARWQAYTIAGITSGMATYALWHLADNLDGKMDASKKQYEMTHLHPCLLQAKRYKRRRNLSYGLAATCFTISILSLIAASSPCTPLKSPDSKGEKAETPTLQITDQS